MWLILASENDLPAKWAAERLEMLHPGNVRLVTAEALGRATDWQLTVGQHEDDLIVQLEDGDVINPSKVRAVLNRIPYVSESRLFGIRYTDKTYVYREMAAFYLSWLNAFKAPMLNPPKPFGLCDAPFHVSSWFRLAEEAGIPTRRSEMRTKHPLGVIWQEAVLPDCQAVNLPARVIVVGDEVIECNGWAYELPCELLASCIAFAEKVEMPLLGLDFVQNAEGQWVLIHVNSLPDLREGGRSVIEAISDYAFSSSAIRN